MARKKQNRGDCAFCGKAYTRSGMKKHLAACDARKAAIQKAEASRAKPRPLFYLVVSDVYERSKYWLHLEMVGTARLEELDAYLRAIWLECCGHLSAFFAGKKKYRNGELEMDEKTMDVFMENTELLHLYDFGTTSETLVEVAGVREGRPLTKNPIVLMARNQPPVYPCMMCGKPAVAYCEECICEEGKSGLLCDEHVVDHPHEEYGEPVDVVNSPRTGMCGYSGPAEPPY